MKKNVLIILNKYLSGVGQNAICIKKILPLINDSLNVHILTFEQERLKDINSNSFIHTVFVKREQKNPFLELLRKRKNIKKGYKKASSIIIENNIDCIISVVYPLESAVILTKLKKKYDHLNTLLYEIDSISNRYKSPKTLYEKIYASLLLNVEQKAFENSNYIVLMKTHEMHYKYKFPSYESKFIISDIPSLDVNNYDGAKITKKEQFKAIYGGNLYKGIRSIDYCLLFFKELRKFIDLSLNVYTNSTDLIANYYEYNEIFYFNKLISNDEFAKREQEADILISLGNKNSDFLPSKVLSSISTGKIVIHFYSDSNDVAIEYLSRYPYAILLNEGVSIRENIEKVLKGLSIIFSSEKISRYHIFKEFYSNTPNCIAEIIKEKVNVKSI